MPRKRGRSDRGRALAPRPAPPSRGEVDRLLDSLDEAMLAGRLEQAGALTERLAGARARATEVLADRLIEGRAGIPFLAFQLLTAFGGKRAQHHLERIAAEERAPDIVRWGARRRAGWPEEGEGEARLTFLSALADGDGTLAEAISQAGGWWPPDGEILQEVLAYLEVLPAERRLAVVRRAVEAQAPEIAWLLRALLHLDDPAVQRLAIAELVRQRDVVAAGALSRLAHTARDPGVRDEARAAERRVRLAVVGAAPAPDPRRLQAWPAVDEVVVSEVDGHGVQALLLTRRWNEQLGMVADFLVKDSWGVKDAHGVSRGPAEGLLDFVLEPLEEDEVELVDVDLPAARGIVAEALRRNAATGQPIPPSFELWEPYLHDAYPPAEDERVAVAELDDAPYAGRADLVQGSDDLLDHPMFGNWVFGPDEVAPLLEHTPPPHGGRWSDRQYRPLIRALVDDATRERLRGRLRRQAWLLDRLEEKEDRDTALAVAASLAKGGEALAQHPFLRGMVQRSVEHLMATLLLDAGLDSLLEQG